MSLDEFYALMELFQEGTLPLKEDGLDFNEPDDEGPDSGEPDTGEPGIGQDANDLYIPRTMFLFSGLNTENLPGMDVAGYDRSRLQEYYNDTSDEGYTRPPEECGAAGTGGLEPWAAENLALQVHGFAVPGRFDYLRTQLCPTLRTAEKSAAR